MREERRGEERRGEERRGGESRGERDCEAITSEHTDDLRLPSRHKRHHVF